MSPQHTLKFTNCSILVIKVSNLGSTLSFTSEEVSEVYQGLAEDNSRHHQGQVLFNNCVGFHPIELAHVWSLVLQRLVPKIQTCKKRMNSNKGDEGVNSSKARRRGRKRFCSQSTATIAANDSCSSTRVGTLTLVKGSFRTPPEPLNSRFTLQVVCPRDPSDKLFSLVPLKSLLGALDVSSGRTRQCLFGSLRSKLEQ
jgi:hypothetical protein